MAERVAVAMSGGVDSSMAALLLLQQGYRVEGLTMRLWQDTPEDAAPDAPTDARSVCRQLGIPHHTLDLRQPFREAIVAYFLQEYARGRTPNPCVRCNQAIKFGLLLDRALRLGYDRLATGHYARSVACGQGWCLQRARDLGKDQSYFMHTLGQRQLAALLLPLGGLLKRQVRALANAQGLAVAVRSESQNACFLSGQDYRTFIRKHLPAALEPGPILDTRGRLLGQHQGLPFYTVGQRGGMGISAARALYVLALDTARNALVVGYAEELGRTTFEAERVVFVAGSAPPNGLHVEAMIRYRGRRVPATLWTSAAQRVRTVLARPLRDVTPGQFVVWYHGENVLGGGVIV